MSGGEPKRWAAVRAAPWLTVLPGWAGGTPDALPTRPHASSTRNAVVMAAGTTVSRLSGFGRVLAVGWVLGQGRLADAYNQANTVPNTIYELLLGGVLSATLLPVLMEALSRKGDDRDEGAVPAVVTFLSALLVVGTALFWLCAPFIVDFFLLRAKGGDVAGERALATTWLRLFTPQLLFIGLTTLTTALLNARRRFGSGRLQPGPRQHGDNCRPVCRRPHGEARLDQRLPGGHGGSGGGGDRDDRRLPGPAARPITGSVAGRRPAVALLAPFTSGAAHHRKALGLDDRCRGL